jgi:glycosyltransferase involved in cell wall biosynthesis
VGRTVGIYLQTDKAGLGGAEAWQACLGDHFSRRGHTVTLLHHKPDVGRATLAAFSGRDLSQVDVEILPGRCAAWHGRQGHTAVTDVSRAFDVFVTITHLVPPICAARAGALIILFPLEPRAHVWPWNEQTSKRSPSRFAPHLVARDWYYRRHWRHVFHSYQVKTTLSAFAQEWAWRLWHTRTDVLYPPTELLAPGETRQPLIASVGRFTVTGTSKHQLELVRLFRDEVGPRASTWRLACLGGQEDSADGQRYLAQVRASAQGAPIEIRADATRSQLSDTLSRAKIFWHAAGLTVDEQEHPEWCEHFGIATVEAMAAGCVPVVIGKGGQTEVVRHGIDGFVCQSLDEMARWTKTLIDDEARLAAMSASARTRAERFSEARSISDLTDLLKRDAGVQM